MVMRVCVHTHQEDQVGLLVKGPGHADPLFLPTRQDDPLRATALKALRFRQGFLQRGVNTARMSARGEKDQGLFPALLVHEEMHHDSGGSEQGHPRLITHKTSHPHSAVMDLH